MDKYVLVEYLNTIKTAVCKTFKHTQRLKLTSFDVSNHYIILGTSNGGIYIFKREPCEFLRLVPSKEGPTVQVKISLNEKSLAMASSRGLVIILENFFVDLNIRTILYTEHDGNTVTVMKWHGNNLYCGDNTGKISVCTVNSTLTQAIFKTTSTLMQLDSSIVQIDTYKSFLLISSKTRTYLCDTEKEQYKQIGKKLRDGNFGACFSQTDLTDFCEEQKGDRRAFKTINTEENFGNVLNNNDVQIYCARPGARLWTVNFSATVLVTYQFRNSLLKNSSDIIIMDNSQEAKLNITKFDNVEISKGFNFGKVFPLYPNIVFTYDNKGVYFFNVKTNNLLCWSHAFDNIKEIKILKPYIYLWRNELQVDIIALQSLEDVVISSLVNKQYLLCSEICIEFNDNILSLVEMSKKIYLISILRTKLEEIEAVELLEKMKNILDKVDKYYNENKITKKSENGIVLVDNQYSVTATLLPDNFENKVVQNVDSSLNECFNIIYKQYVLNKTHRMAELTESSKILNNFDLNKLPSLFESFVKFVKEKNNEDASFWCKEQTIKLAAKNRDDLENLESSTVEFISNSFLELNDYKTDCCKCKFPLPIAHKRKLEHYNLACKLYDYTENKQNYLNNIPFLYKRKASEILNLSLIIQYSDKEVFKENLDKISYDMWDEIIQSFLKLNKGQCLNCPKKIDTKGTLTWSEVGLIIVESVGPKNATMLLGRYARFIPKGQLNIQFYQSCIFSTMCDKERRIVENVGFAKNSQMVGNVSHNENGIGTATTITKNSKNVANKQETDDRLFILTGTVSKIMQWNNILKNHSCYFELIGTVVSLENGTVETQKIMLLRERTGPVLQVVYYQLTHIDVDDFHLGKVIRCVGRMIGHNVLHAFCIRGASTEEMENLQRLTLISEHAVSLHLKNEFADCLEKFLLRKYMSLHQSQVKDIKTNVSAMKCSYCQLSMKNTVLEDIKKCDCGNNFHQICFNNNDNCKFCLNETNG